MDSYSSPEQFARLLKQMVTSVHDQVAAAKEEAETTLQLAAELETQLTPTVDSLKKGIERIVIWMMFNNIMTELQAHYLGFLISGTLGGLWAGQAGRTETADVIRGNLVQAGADWRNLMQRINLEITERRSARMSPELRTWFDNVVRQIRDMAQQSNTRLLEGLR